jgi:uncharacterized membrane protein
MNKPTSAKRDVTPYALAVAGVLFASICFGFVPFFSRGLTDQGLAPYAVAFYRYILAAIVLLPALLKHRSKWREILWGLVAGAVMGLGWVGYVTALETVPASTVGVLYMTYPVFTIAIAWALFGDQPTRRSLVAAGFIVVAAIIAGSPTSVPPDQIPTLPPVTHCPFGQNSVSLAWIGHWPRPSHSLIRGRRNPSKRRERLVSDCRDQPCNGAYSATDLHRLFSCHRGDAHCCHRQY